MEGSRELIRLICAANDGDKRVPVLLDLRHKLEDLKLTIRLCKDLKAFANFNSYQYAINEVVDMSKQNEGWLKASRKRGEPAFDHLPAVHTNRQNSFSLTIFMLFIIFF